MLGHSLVQPLLRCCIPISEGTGDTWKCHLPQSISAKLAKEPSLSAWDGESQHPDIGMGVGESARGHQHWKWDLERPQLVITVTVIVKEYNDQEQTARFSGKSFFSWQYL